MISSAPTVTAVTAGVPLEAGVFAPAFEPVSGRGYVAITLPGTRVGFFGMYSADIECPSPTTCNGLTLCEIVGPPAGSAAVVVSATYAPYRSALLFVASASARGLLNFKLTAPAGYNIVNSAGAVDDVKAQLGDLVVTHQLSATGEGLGATAGCADPAVSRVDAMSVVVSPNAATTTYTLQVDGDNAADFDVVPVGSNVPAVTISAFASPGAARTLSRAAVAVPNLEGANVVHVRTHMPTVAAVQCTAPLAATAGGHVVVAVTGPAFLGRVVDVSNPATTQTVEVIRCTDGPLTASVAAGSRGVRVGSNTILYRGVARIGVVTTLNTAFYAACPFGLAGATATQCEGDLTTLAQAATAPGALTHVPGTVAVQAVRSTSGLSATALATTDAAFAVVCDKDAIGGVGRIESVDVNGKVATSVAFECTTSTAVVGGRAWVSGVAGVPFGTPGTGFPAGNELRVVVPKPSMYMVGVSALAGPAGSGTLPDVVPLPGNAVVGSQRAYTVADAHAEPDGVPRRDPRPAGARAAR